VSRETAKHFYLSIWHLDNSFAADHNLSNARKERNFCQQIFFYCVQRMNTEFGVRSAHSGRMESVYWGDYPP
jgi:hypothetical protein